MCCISVGDLRAVHLHFNISILPCKWHYDRTATACSSFHRRYDGDKNLSVALAHAFGVCFLSSPFENPTNQISFTTVLISSKRNANKYLWMPFRGIYIRPRERKRRTMTLCDVCNDTAEPCSLSPPPLNTTIFRVIRHCFSLSVNVASLSFDCYKTDA